MYLFRFLVLNAVILYAYFTNYQQVDEEEFGGAWELTKEGFVTSLAGFLVRMIRKLPKIIQANIIFMHSFLSCFVSSSANINLSMHKFNVLIMWVVYHIMP